MNTATDTFERDLQAGKEIEQRILTLIQEKYPRAKEIPGKQKAWDIFIPELWIGVEVKSDQKSQDTGNIVVEIEFNGKPSALSTTEAHWWVFFTGTELIWIQPHDIHKCIRELHLKPATFTGRGDTCPKKAYLIRKNHLTQYASSVQLV